MINVARTHSILFSTLNTNLPMPKPNGMVIHGALNLSQASIKLIALTKPIHNVDAIKAMGK